MQILISALHFDWDGIERCLAGATELGLDGVELSLHRSMQHPHCTADDLAELQRANERFGLILTAHIWDDLAQLGPIRGEQELIGWLDVCCKAGIGELVAHGGSFPEREEGLQRVRDLLARVIGRFETRGVMLHVENHYAYDYRDCHELLSEPREFLELFGAVENTALGFCLDTGHANMSGNTGALVRQLKDRLDYVHIADNHGENDDHCAYGEGTIDWPGVLGLLKETGFDGAFCLEFPVRLNKAPFEMCVADLCERFTRDLADTSDGSDGQPDALTPAGPLAQGGVELVTVYQTSMLWYAAQVKMWLEDEGIPCVIVDSNMPVIYPLGTVSMTKVQVLRGDREAALQVLREQGEA